MVWLVRGTYVMSRVRAGVSGEVAERERGGRGEDEERMRRGGWVRFDLVVLD